MKNYILFAGLAALSASYACAATKDRQTAAPSVQPAAPSWMKEIKSEKEYRRLAKSSSPTVIVFNSDSCSACDDHKDDLEPLQTKYRNVSFYSFNASGDDLAAFRKEKNIQGYPTTEFIKGGKIQRSLLGAFGEDPCDGFVYELVHGKPRPMKRKEAAAEQPPAKKQKV